MVMLDQRALLKSEDHHMVDQITYHPFFCLAIKVIGKHRAACNVCTCDI